MTSLRTPYDGIVMAAPVTVPYVRYSIESRPDAIDRFLLFEEMRYSFHAVNNGWSRPQ